jgi:hypothetical protein
LGAGRRGRGGGREPAPGRRLRPARSSEAGLCRIRARARTRTGTAAAAAPPHRRRRRRAAACGAAARSRAARAPPPEKGYTFTKCKVFQRVSIDNSHSKTGWCVQSGWGRGDGAGPGGGGWSGAPGRRGGSAASARAGRRAAWTAPWRIRPQTPAGRGKGEAAGGERMRASNRHR